MSIFGLQLEVTAESVGEEGGETDAFAIQHRDGKAVEKVLLRQIDAAVVVVGTEPGALQVETKRKRLAVKTDGLTEGIPQIVAACVLGGIATYMSLRLEE